MYPIHHVAVTASNFERSLEFYQKLGFKVLVKRDVPEKQKRIALLDNGHFKLELFWYADTRDDPETRDTMGNNVHDVGAKHFALRVDSMEEIRAKLKELGIPMETEPAPGDTGYDFFFIRDPDGIWIEFVQDDVHD
jgi:catechol 2,3-dioxygenase-like lactoylglutathione lyase family enzyme